MENHENKIESVVEYNNRQASFHMTFHSDTGKKYSRGYVVTDTNGVSCYYKTKALAESAKHEVFTKEETSVLPSEREYDWGVEMSYRLTGKGSEHISLTKSTI